LTYIKEILQIEKERPTSRAFQYKKSLNAYNTIEEGDNLHAREELIVINFIM
jgi:hypothetical protein